MATTPPKKKKKPKPPPIYVEVRYPAWLGIASIAWALAGWLIAAAAPHLAFVPLISLLNYLLPAATIGLIGANLLFAVRDLWRGAHPLRLLVVTGLQLGLFTTLFFQIYAHLGAEYYEVDGPTSAWQWVAFSFAHAVRASDIVDFIEAYSLRVQPIKHNGWLVACFVILYHVVIDVFVLGILWNALNRIKRRLMKDENVSFFVRWGVVSVLSLWFLAWILVAFVIYPWSPVDVPLWFLENVLRVLDFADIMESFDIHLHGIPRHGINGTLTFLCRIFIGIGIAFILGKKKKTAQKRVMTPPDESPFPYWIKRVGIVFGILIGLCLFGMVTQAVLGDPATRLAEAVGGDDDGRTQAALSGLRRMGPAAQATIPTLLEARQRTAPPVPDDITRVLGYFGTAAIKPLADIARGKDEGAARVAVESLGRIGAPSSARIAEAWSVTPFESVRQEAEAELRELGSEAVPGIMEITTLANAEVHYHWFQELDRNWRLRHTSNEVARALQELPDLLRRLDNNPGAAAFKDICGGLRKCGTAARQTAPKMLDYLSDRDKEIAAAAEEVVAAIGPELTPELLRRADDPKLKAYDAVQLKLDEPFVRLLCRSEMWDAKALKDPRALPMLTQIIGRKDAPYTARATFLKVMKDSGADAKDAIPVLIALLADEDADNRAQVRTTLVSIDPNWQKHPLAGQAIPQLIPRLAKLIAEPATRGKEVLESEEQVAARKAAAEELFAALGPIDPAGAPALIRALVAAGPAGPGDKKASMYRAKLVETVQRLGPKLKPAGPAMAKYVMASDTDLRGKQMILACMKPLDLSFDVMGPAFLSYYGQSHASLELIQKHGQEAIPHLSGLLADEKPNPKYFAVWAAEKLEAVARPLVPKLVELLGEKDEPYQIALFDDLKGDNRRLTKRERVLLALKAIDPEWLKHPAAGKGLAAAVARVAEESEEAQKSLYRMLGDMGPAARPLIPDIAQLALAPKRCFTKETVSALDKIDERWREHEAVKAVIPEVCRRFAKGDVSTSQAIALLGPAAAAELENALEGASPMVRDQAIRLLTTTSGSIGKEAIPTIVRQLGTAMHPDATVELLKKLNAADPQWTANPKLKDIIPKMLDEVAKGEWREHRFKHICNALGDKALPYALDKLASAKSEDRRFGLLALAEIGPPAKSGIPAVQKVMKDSDTNVRQASIEALLKIGPGNKTLVEPIGLMLLDKDSGVLSTAQGALDKIDPQWRKSKWIKPAHAGLLKNLQSKDHVVRIMALVSIETCGRFDGVLPVLERLMKSDPDAGARRRAEILVRQFNEKK